MYLSLPHVHFPLDAPTEYYDQHIDEQEEDRRRHYAMLSHMDTMMGDLVRGSI